MLYHYATDEVEHLKPQKAFHYHINLFVPALCFNYTLLIVHVSTVAQGPHLLK